MIDMASWWSKQVPIGGNRRYLITCDGHPFAGFDDLGQAQAALGMYSQVKKVVKGAAVTTAAHRYELVNR
jgi:hypothetical protein